MSASWMKANGMRDNSNAEELARRKNFMVHDRVDNPALPKPEPTAEEWARAAANGRAEVARKRMDEMMANLRLATAMNNARSWWRKLVGVNKTVLSAEELAALPKVDTTIGEQQYSARWTQDYVDSLKPAKWLVDAVKKFNPAKAFSWGWRACLDWLRWENFKGKDE